MSESDLIKYIITIIKCLLNKGLQWHEQIKPIFLDLIIFKKIKSIYNEIAYIKTLTKIIVVAIKVYIKFFFEMI